MDVNTNGLSTGGYRGGSYFGGGGGSAAGGEQESDQFYAPRPRAKHQGDSLSGLTLARRADANKKNAKTDPEQVMKAAKLTRFISWALSAVSFLIFAILFLQPILLPIFTFGAVFSGGFGDWVEFTTTILKVSLFPAAAGIIFGWIGYFANRKVNELSASIEEASHKAASLMNRFAS